jgi:hypothetical protein
VKHEQIPPNIGQDVNPGGLVIIHFDEHARTLRQSNIKGDRDSVMKATDDGLWALNYPGRYIVTCFYDGDSGDPFAPAIYSERKDWTRFVDIDKE